MNSFDGIDNIGARRSRIGLATASIATAAARASAAVGYGTPAAAQTYFVALAYSFQSDIGGMKGLAITEEEARIGALKDCQDSQDGP